MKRLKKYAIGYNTVSSMNGVISARGVKSYPKNLEIFGYTQEIGEGEKSPNNLYKLISLDSGNMNLYSESKVILNTVGRVTSTGVTVYGIELPHPKSGYYCIQANPSTEYPITYNFYDIETNELIEKNWNIAINSDNKDKGKIIKVDDGLGLLLYDCRNGSKASFTKRTNLMILDTSIMPSEYITDEHSIVLTNNNTTIQVPTPIALNSIDGVSDYIYKDTDGIWKLKQLFMTFDSTKYLDSLKLTSTSSTSSTYQIVYKDSNPLAVKEYCVSTYYKSNMFSLVNFEESRDNIAKFFRNNDYFSLYLRYSSEDYPQFSDIDTLRAWLVDNPIKIVYNSNMIKEHILSDYAQDLLNSFMIQNQNEIFVEGYPDLKVSGYIQK